MKIRPYISFDLAITVDFNTSPLPDEVAELYNNGFSLLAAWRRYRGLSQKELSKRAGVPTGTLANHEARWHKPPKRTLQKIAAALEIGIEQLIE